MGSPIMELNNIPPDTTIISAVDTNTGFLIENDGRISSPGTILFEFSGLDDLAVVQFLCSIDNSPAFYCASPYVFDNAVSHNNNFQNSGITTNPDGTIKHTIQISSIDASSNVDPTPATFSWNTEFMDPLPPQLHYLLNSITSSSSITSSNSITSSSSITSSDSITSSSSITSSDSITSSSSITSIKHSRNSVYACTINQNTKVDIMRSTKHNGKLY